MKGVNLNLKEVCNTTYESHLDYGSKERAKYFESEIEYLSVQLINTCRKFKLLA